jgi:predicted aminopeptidase
MRILLLLIVISTLSACSDFGYYWHSTRGHLALMNKRVDIDDMLENTDLDTNLRGRLLLVKNIRAFSVDELALPDSGSYHNYVQLDRDYLLQNLFAAKEFSTQLHSWCFPVAGCLSYRGYYDEELLNEYANQLRAENFDLHIGYVPAYSTLGWFDDPVLSSFINWPDYRLAGLLFHELTHQRIYIDNDTQFNESLAVAIEQAGTELWLKASNQGAQLEEFTRWIVYRREVVSLIEQTRSQLTRLYQMNMDDSSKRQEKQSIFASSREGYAEIAERLNYQDGFKDWFAGELNNAKIGSVSAYSIHVPAFLAIAKTLNYNFEAFFTNVEKIGAMDKAERDRCLASWTDGTSTESRPCPKTPAG